MSKEKFEKKDGLIVGVTKAIFANFTQAHEVSRIKHESGSEYPGYHCPERKDLNDKLKNLPDPHHHKAVADVNDGHDHVKTPLHPAPKEALVKQALENHEDGLSPFMPHRKTHSQEMRNSIAFFRASQDPQHSAYRHENLAGAIIHSGKGIVEGAMVDLVPSEEYKI